VGISGKSKEIQKNSPENSSKFIPNKNLQKLQQISINIIDHVNSLVVTSTDQFIALQIEAIDGFPQPIDDSPHTDFILDAFAGQPGIHRFLDVFLVMGLVFAGDCLELVLGPLAELAVFGC
jgi:hypothetical protein